MTVTMFQSSAEPTDKIQPTASLRIDSDGDVWMKFQETDYRTQIDVVMSKAQFLAFAADVTAMASGPMKPSAEEEESVHA